MARVCIYRLRTVPFSRAQSAASVSLNTIMEILWWQISGAQIRPKTKNQKTPALFNGRLNEWNCATAACVCGFSPSFLLIKLYFMQLTDFMNKAPPPTRRKNSKKKNQKTKQTKNQKRSEKIAKSQRKSSTECIKNSKSECDDTQRKTWGVSKEISRQSMDYLARDWNIRTCGTLFWP